MSTKLLKSGDSVTFLIKKHKFGKEGLKIMPEDENLNLKINGHILEQAVETIRYRVFLEQLYVVEKQI